MTRLTSENLGYRWVILGTVFSVQAIVSMASFSFGPLAPFLREEFAITRAEVGLFNSLISLASALLGLPAGWLVDRYGVRRLMFLGSGLFGLVLALLWVAPSIGIAYAITFLAAIGFVFVTPTTTMALVRWFPPASRATAVGLKQSALTIGSSLAAVIVPSMALIFGWRNTIAVLGLAVAVVAAVSFAIYREPIRVLQAQLRAPLSAAMHRVLTNSRLLRLGLVGVIYYSLQICTAGYLVLQMVEVRGVSVVVAGTFLMATNLGGAAGRVLWGFVSDRVFNVRRKPVLFMIGIMSGTLAIVLAIGAAGMPEWLLYIVIVAFGAAAFGWNAVQLTFATEISGKEDTATGLGWLVSLTNIGAAFSVPIFGYIVDRTSSYSLAWLIFGSLTIIAALSVLLIREHDGEKRDSALPKAP